MAKKGFRTREQLKNAAVAVVGTIGARLAKSIGEGKNEILVARQDIDNIIRDWPAIPKKAAIVLMEKYGEPNEASASQLIWYNNSPWKRTVLLREEVPHNFPLPHNDILMQFINYKVPEESIGDILEFNGSLLIDRTAGEVAARCDSEERNFLTLNLMNDIVKGKLTAEEARKKYADVTVSHLLHRSTPYVHKFHFELPSGQTGFHDRTKVTETVLQAAAETAKEVLDR